MIADALMNWLTRRRMIPHVEVVIVRDPDGPTEAQVFVNGVEYEATIFNIDAGAGWHWSDWKSIRDSNLSAASPITRANLLTGYANPPGGHYIERDNNIDWLDDLPPNSVQ
ncbi:hypothetical protein OIE68_22035 [Nocardia vinacea]|uniref:hypothetical protein n=1 Tax=Nocardia vinacea TaxID=96468 RepID=UPI002E0F0A2A|nr:hypothetical protein OIE68_22035 [Nocardia vinacea]